MKYFGGIKTEKSNKQDAAIYLQSIPYDGTSTWGKGANKGFRAFLEATENMELYDIETDSEVYREGIWILPEINDRNSPESVFQSVYSVVKDLTGSGKFLTFFGGEHSVSIGIIRAFYEKYPGLTVLQLDAHADLRPEYEGTPYNHACAVHDAALHANLIQVGIRSMDTSELPFFNRDKCFLASEINDTTDWMERSIDLMSEKVYITFDLDALDPSIMPATGTPEPGGLDWTTTINYLKKVFRSREVVGFDIVELAPISGLHHPEFLAAKLYYKMLSYKFYDHGRETNF